MAGDPNRTVLHDLYHAVIRGYTNEESIDQKSEEGDNGGDQVTRFDDPIKRRIGAWPPPDGRKNFYLGAYAFDLLSGDPNDPTRYEKIFIAGKLDVVDGEVVPVLEVYMQDNATTITDATMRVRFRISPKRIESMVPFRDPANGPTDRMTSTDGRFVTISQTDGHMVQYDTRLGSVGTPAAAVWSSWYGVLKPLPW